MEIGGNWWKWWRPWVETVGRDGGWGRGVAKVCSEYEHYMGPRTGWGTYCRQLVTLVEAKRL